MTPTTPGATGPNHGVRPSSLFLLGFGSYALFYGCRPYLLATIGTLIGLVFGIEPGNSSVVAQRGSAPQLS